MYSTSIIIPAYNEEENIGKLLDSINKLNGQYQVIVVDDGSEDRTSEIVKSKGFKPVRISRNRGKGYACRIGARKATSNFIVFIDGDFQFNPKQIPDFENLLKTNDIVLGVRKHKDIPFARVISNKFAQVVVNKTAGTNFEDVLCGFRGIRKDVFHSLKLRKNRYEMESELVLRSANKKFRITLYEHCCRLGFDTADYIKA